MTNEIRSLAYSACLLVGHAHARSAKLTIYPKKGRWVARFQGTKFVHETEAQTPREACDALCSALGIDE